MSFKKNILICKKTKNTSPYIIAELKGGLGNQLFIYAATRQLSVKYKIPLILDNLSEFVNDAKYKRIYLLNNLKISAFPAKYNDCFLSLKRKIQKYFITYLATRGIFYGKWRVINEFQIKYINPCCKNYITGYWQSEKYFIGIKKTIRKEFRPLEQIVQKVCYERCIIQKHSNSVAVCIRKGADRPHQNSSLETNVEFYKAALFRLSSQHPDAHVFVFSDNPFWVSDYFRCRIPYTVISYKPESWRAVEDLCLMMSCKHFVIGNSTFHWWGAWLGERTGSQIFVPKRFAEAYPNFYPKRWQRI